MPLLLSAPSRNVVPWVKPCPFEFLDNRDSSAPAKAKNSAAADAKARNDVPNQHRET